MIGRWGYALVEAEDDRTKAILLERLLKGVNTALVATPEHGPELVAQGISLRGLVDTPVVDTGRKSIMLIKLSCTGLRTQQRDPS